MLKGLSYIMIKWNDFLYCMFDVATVIFILGWGLKNNNFENSMILSLMSMVTMSIILFVKEATIYSKRENNVNVKLIENIFEGSW